MDHNQERRRGHFHRGGRRGPDRRGNERRTPLPQGQGQEQGGRDHVDVEQIMRDIRARISQRHGIDLSSQQIQELAARRLEAILDPRSIKPGLLDELRRSAGAPPPQPDPADAAELSYTFEDTTLYESSRGVLVFIRRLLNPILKLFFNPNPLIRALNLQARWNGETARRLAERDRRQTEWNALHYELLHRMVTEVSKVSLELQSLSSQIESLSAKVDFNERRVRNMEATTHQARPVQRSPEPASPPAASGTPPAASGVEAPIPDVAPEGGHPSESTRRRRRRRRGRRGSGAPSEGMAGSPNQPVSADADPDAGADPGDDLSADDGADEQSAPAFAPVPETAQIATAAPEPPPPVDVPAHVENQMPEPEPPAPAPEQREPQE